MICDKCNNMGIINTALNKSFYYCKNCKEEIFLKSNNEKNVPPTECKTKVAVYRMLDDIPIEELLKSHTEELEAYFDEMFKNMELGLD